MIKKGDILRGRYAPPSNTDFPARLLPYTETDADWEVMWTDPHAGGRWMLKPVGTAGDPEDLISTEYFLQVEPAAGEARHEPSLGELLQEKAKPATLSGYEQLRHEREAVKPCSPAAREDIKRQLQDMQAAIDSLLCFL